MCVTPGLEAIVTLSPGLPPRRGPQEGAQACTSWVAAGAWPIFHESAPRPELKTPRSIRLNTGVLRASARRRSRPGRARQDAAPPRSRGGATPGAVPAVWGPGANQHGLRRHEHRWAAASSWEGGGGGDVGRQQQLVQLHDCENGLAFGRIEAPGVLELCLRTSRYPRVRGKRRPRALAPSRKNTRPARPGARAAAPSRSVGTTSTIHASFNATGPCYTDPTAAQCATFKRADAEWTSDVASLCSAMSFMSGCTLWDQCEVRSGCRGHGVRACVRACVHACVRACLRACVPACVRACLPACRCAGPWQRAATGLIPETLAPPLCLAGGRSNWRLLQARQHHRQPVHRHAQGGGQAQAGQTSTARRACC